MSRAFNLLLAFMFTGFLWISAFSAAANAEEASCDNNSTNSEYNKNNLSLEDRKFYLKVMADKGFFKNSKTSGSKETRKYKNHSIVNSSDFAAGYYFNKEFRGEILFHQEYNNKFASSNKAANGVSYNRKFENNISALMLGLNMNVLDFDYGNLFLLGNLGVASVQGKYSNSLTNQANNVSRYSQKGKKQNNFSYGLGVGADFKLSERLHAEIAYRFNDFGTTKSMLSPNGTYQRGKLKLQSHNAMLGLRLDM